MLHKTLVGFVEGCTADCGGLCGGLYSTTVGCMCGRLYILDCGGVCGRHLSTAADCTDDYT